MCKKKELEKIVTIMISKRNLFKKASMRKKEIDVWCFFTEEAS